MYSRIRVWMRFRVSNAVDSFFVCGNDEMRLWFLMQRCRPKRMRLRCRVRLTEKLLPLTDDDDDDGDDSRIHNGYILRSTEYIHTINLRKRRRFFVFQRYLGTSTRDLLSVWDTAENSGFCAVNLPLMQGENDGYYVVRSSSSASRSRRINWKSKINTSKKSFTRSFLMRAFLLYERLRFRPFFLFILIFSISAWWSSCVDMNIQGGIELEMWRCDSP